MWPALPPCLTSRLNLTTPADEATVTYYAWVHLESGWKRSTIKKESNHGRPGLDRIALILRHLDLSSCEILCLLEIEVTLRFSVVTWSRPQITNDRDVLFWNFVGVVVWFSSCYDRNFETIYIIFIIRACVVLKTRLSVKICVHNNLQEIISRMERLK